MTINNIFEGYLKTTELLQWEIWLRGFCIGFFAFGLLIFVIVLFTMGLSVGHDVSHDISHDVSHDVSHDIDHSIDKDVAFDHEISVDKDLAMESDISVDKDITIDKDVSIDHDVHIDIADHATGPMSLEKGSSAPLLLVLAVFSITFGGLGLLLFWQEPTMNSYGRVAAIILTPIALSIIIDRLWRKIAVSETYRLPTNHDFIGKEAVVAIKVNANGGLVRVEIPDQLEPLKVPAKAVHKHEEFLPEELVFIIGVKDNFYLVDNTRDLLEGKAKKYLEEDDSNKGV